MLDRYQLAPEKSDIGPELRVLRGLLLLIKLTGQVFPSLHPHIAYSVLAQPCLLPGRSTLHHVEWSMSIAPGWFCPDG